MALDLIKQYLIGIGFNVDENSVRESDTFIDKTEEKIKNFNKDSTKGFSDTGESIKNLFSLFSKLPLTKLFPELQKPFNSLMENINTIKKLYKSIPKKKDPKEKEDTGNFSFKNISQVISKAKEKLNLLTKGSKEGLSSIKKLLVDGCKSFSNFSIKGTASFAIVITSVIALIGFIKKLSSYLNKLANQDIEYEKLSRQLWTTKEDARDIDSSLKTLGVTMQDLWLSPTLLKQFNQLRKDAKNLRLPPEFKDNIKVVQGIGLEFKRLKQSGTLAFQWIGHYILKYCSGPLVDIKRGLHKFNNGLLKTIPHVAKVIGSLLGIILRLILTIGKVLEPIVNILKKIFNIIFYLIDKIPGPIKKILKIIGLLALLIISGPVGAILLVIAALDDFFTFLRGGKSIIGSVFGFFKEKGITAMKSVSNKFKDLKDKFKNGMASLKDDWNSYWDKASKTLDKLKNKAQKVWGKIKEWSKGLWSKNKDFVANIKSKVDVYNKKTANKSVPANYLNTSVSNKSTTSNSNNKISNSNTINVYGNDAQQTANAINKNLLGINTRNFQGAFQ